MVSIFVDGYFDKRNAKYYGLQINHFSNNISILFECSFFKFHRGWGDASNEVRPLFTHVSQVSLCIRSLFHAQN